MTELELVQKAIDDKIGKDIVTLKLDSAVADYFVIATANAPNHAQSIIDEVEKSGRWKWLWDSRKRRLQRRQLDFARS